MLQRDHEKTAAGLVNSVLCPQATMPLGILKSVGKPVTWHFEVLYLLGNSLDVYELLYKVNRSLLVFVLTKRAGNVAVHTEVSGGCGTASKIFNGVHSKCP